MHIQVIQNSQSSITSYDDTSLTISEQKYNQSVFITSSNIDTIDKSIIELNSLAISNIPLKTHIDIIIIGGKALTPLNMPLNLQNQLFKEGISLEIMSTGAACRTFNLLLSEGRDVGFLMLF